MWQQSGRKWLERRTCTLKLQCTAKLMFLLNFCIYFVFTSNGLKMYYLTKHTIVTKIVFIWGDRDCGKDKPPATGGCQVFALPDAGNLN